MSTRSKSPLEGLLSRLMNPSQDGPPRWLVTQKLQVCIKVIVVTTVLLMLKMRRLVVPVAIGMAATLVCTFFLIEENTPVSDEHTSKCLCVDCAAANTAAADVASVGVTDPVVPLVDQARMAQDVRGTAEREEFRSSNETRVFATRTPLHLGLGDDDAVLVSPVGIEKFVSRLL